MIETLIENNLRFYYFLLILVLAFSIVLNSKKEVRIYQTRISIYYLIVSLIMFVIFATNYAISDTLANLSPSYGNDLVTIIIILLLTKLEQLLEIFIKSYPLIVLVVLGIGICQKLLVKIEAHMAMRSKDCEKNLSKISNFITKKLYKDSNNINENGRILIKVSQNIAFTFIVLYLVMPIFWYFEIEMIYSLSITILIAITFLELYFSLNVSELKVAPIIVEDKLKDKMSIQKYKFGDLLKLSQIENFEGNKKMIQSKQTLEQDSTALVCEAYNFEIFKEINMKIMNSVFFENKKILVISSSEKNAKEYYERLTDFNKEYDGKNMLKLLTNEDKLFDSFADIYVSTLENCFGNIKLLNRVDTIVIEDIDIIMQKRLELLRAFSSIVKIGNSKMNYIIFTYMLQGIEATIKSLLFVKNVTWYGTEDKQQPKEFLLNVWDKRSTEIGDTLLSGKINKNFGNLVPLAILSLKQNPDRILLISSDEPINFQLNEFNAIKNLNKKELENTEIEKLNKNIRLSTREKYFEYKAKNAIITNDKNNLYERIYKLSLINGEQNVINIVSEQYLLRDYMITTYNENKMRLKRFLPYVPYEVNSSKVILYNLLLQLTNFGVSEKNISRIFNENGISISLGKGNNKKLIADKLTYYIKREFDINIDTYSYITIEDADNKYTFDATEKSFVRQEKIYILDSIFINLFPNELFKKVNFVKDGFPMEIESENLYNFNQKYLPGQKHCFEGIIYEVKNIIDMGNEVNAILEASTNYDNITYRQRREVSIIGDMHISEARTHKYTNISARYTVGKIDIEVDTPGYFEFSNGVTMNLGDYRYVELDEQTRKRILRKHRATNVLKLEFSKGKNDVPDIKEIFSEANKKKVAELLSFLISETLVTLLGENHNYIQVKAALPKQELENYEWVSPVYISDCASDKIEIYIFEDVEISRGLVSVIYKNMDNIFGIIYDYLEWVQLENKSSEEVSKNKYNLTKKMLKEIIMK